MSRLILLTSLMAAIISAQADHAAPGFKYIGCVEAEAPVFSWDAALPAPFSAQQCQHACHAKGKYAALDGAGCHCDEASAKTEESQYKVLDESVCGIPCVGGNATAGFCGGPECPVTGKKRYSLYKKEKEDDDCEKEHGDKNKGIGTGNKEIPVKTTTAFKTVTSCPPEVTNCPLTALTKVVEPSSVTKHQTTSSADPATPPCPENCGPPCPPEGCPSCPPEGCLPPCPPGCPLSRPRPALPPPKPECPGENCRTSAPTATATATCPPGGCVKLVTDPVPSHPWPTHSLVPTKVPATISRGVRYEASMLMAVTALIMAASLL